MYNVYIWGAGDRLETVYSAIDKKKCNVLGIVDKDKNKIETNWKFGVKIFDTSILIKQNYDFVVISVLNFEEVSKEAFNLGVDAGKVICFWEKKYDIGIFNYLDSTRYCYKQMDIYRYRLLNYSYELGYHRRPNIIDSESTLKAILRDSLSLARFGDGEWDLMFNKKRSWFQTPNSKLSARLLEVFNSNNNNILIAIADNFSNLDRYTDEAADGIREYMVIQREKIENLIDYSRIYYDAYVTRPYMIYKERNHAEKIFSIFKEILYGRDVLLVEGIGSRIGVSNDFYSEANSVRRIVCPQKNCWDKYKEIISCIKKNARKDDLICISLGATATVLAYDLCKCGFQALDIGQIDNEYEWYLMEATERVPILGKMVSEIGEGVMMDEKSLDLKEYYSSIVGNIKS